MSCVTWLPKSRIRTRSVMGWIASSVARNGSASSGSRSFLRRGLARQHGDEEAVGAVARRREPQHVALGGRRAADGLGPDGADRQQREIAVRGEEALDLRLVLLAQQRAGDIDQPAAGLGQPGRTAEDLALERGELGKILRPEPPFGVGVAPPGPGAGAGRVDEDAVEAVRMALHPFVALAGERHALNDRDAGAAQALRRALEPALRYVAGDEVAAIGHAGGQRQRLAAGAGAEIDDAQAGPRIGEQRRELR